MGLMGRMTAATSDAMHARAAWMTALFEADGRGGELEEESPKSGDSDDLLLFHFGKGCGGNSFVAAA